MISLALLAANQGDGPVLTLDDAVNIALNNAFSVQTAKSQLEQTRQRVNEIKGSLGPKVNLGATYTRYGSAISQGGITFVPIDQKQATASLSMPIDIMGNISRGVRAAQAELLAFRETVDTVANNLKRDVRGSYFSVGQAKEQVAVEQIALKDQQDRLTNIQQQFNAGVLAKVDVLRQQVQVSQAQADLINAQNALALAKESFNNTLGRAVETPFDVPSAAGSALLPVGASDEAIVKAALATRPEIKSLKANAEALHEITIAEERSLQPSLAVSANYSHTIDPPPSSRANQVVGVLALTVPVFDSGVTRARVKQDRQAEVQNQILLKQTSLGVSLEVRQATTNLVNAKARVDVATAQVTSAEETYRLAVLRLNAGQGILLEVIDAEADLTRARTGLVAARYNYLTAYADLQRAIGADDLQATINRTQGATK